MKRYIVLIVIGAIALTVGASLATVSGFGTYKFMVLSAVGALCGTIAKISNL